MWKRQISGEDSSSIGLLIYEMSEIVSVNTYLFFDRFNASDASCLGFSDPVKNAQDLEAELSDDSGDVLIILKRDGLQKTPFTNIGDFEVGLSRLFYL